MPETAENVATDYQIRRADQDPFAWRSQQRTEAAWARILRQRADAVRSRRRRARLVASPATSTRARKPRSSSWPGCRRRFASNGTVTAGNASGVNDGACALLVASAEAALSFNLTPRARVVDGGAAGVEPRVYGHRSGAGHAGACSRSRA